MPHKRAKRSLREAAKDKRGFDNPPTASDSLSSLSSSAKAKGKGKGKGKVDEDRYGGVTKNVYRILNGEKLRDELKLKRKREREKEGGSERDGGGNILGNKKQKKEDLKLLPHETLRDFNRRVEQALQPKIAEAAKSSRASKKRKKQKTGESAGDDEDDKEDDEGFEFDEERPWRKRKPSTATTTTTTNTTKPTDPKAKANPAASDPTKIEPKKEKKERLTEFAVAPRLKLNDIVQEPPSLKRLPRQAQKIRSAAATGGGGAGGEGGGSLESHRLPISMAQRKAMEEERKKAIRQYRELKEKSLAERDEGTAVAAM